MPYAPNVYSQIINLINLEGVIQIPNCESRFPVISGSLLFWSCAFCLGLAILSQANKDCENRTMCTHIFHYFQPRGFKIIEKSTAFPNPVFKCSCLKPSRRALVEENRLVSGCDWFVSTILLCASFFRVKSSQQGEEDRILRSEPRCIHWRRNERSGWDWLKPKEEDQPR